MRLPTVLSLLAVAVVGGSVVGAHAPASAGPGGWTLLAASAGVSAVPATPSRAVATRVAAAERPSPRGDVTLAVPALTVVRLDDRGRPAAAWTNSGRAPRAGDRVLLAQGHTTAPASAVQRAELLAAADRCADRTASDGGWRPGRWVALTGC